MRQRTLEALKSHSLSFNGIFGALRPHGALSYGALRQVVGALQRDGLIARRHGGPWALVDEPREVPDSLRARSVPIPPPVASVDDPRLRGEIRRVLESGASYSPDEVLRNIRSAFPVLSRDTVVAALESFADAGGVERVRLGTMTRFRGLPSADRGGLA